MSAPRWRDVRQAPRSFVLTEMHEARERYAAKADAAESIVQREGWLRVVEGFDAAIAALVEP